MRKKKAIQVMLPAHYDNLDLLFDSMTDDETTGIWINPGQHNFPGYVYVRILSLERNDEDGSDVRRLQWKGVLAEEDPGLPGNYERAVTGYIYLTRVPAAYVDVNSDDFAGEIVFTPKPAT